MNNLPEISVVVLAAGRSTRMGTSKLSLPWDGSSVIGTVCQKFHDFGVEDIVVVLGGYADEVQDALRKLDFYRGITIRKNEDPVNSEMIDSMKIGLGGISQNSRYVFIALGDNPQVSGEVITEMITNRESAPIVIPSFQMRRGHPWLVSRSLIKSLLSVPAGKTMRDWLNAHADEIFYLGADRSVLMDLDTPADYNAGNSV